MINKQDFSIYTDYYQLTMMQGYFLAGRSKDTAVFDYFFRNLPFEGGYVVFAGLADVLQLVEQLHFTKEHLDYLRQQGMNEDFLNYLKTFRFTGSIYSMREGEVVFPSEPIVRIHSTLPEAQLIETMLLNLLNFQSLIATKAARIRSVIGWERKFLDMGLRRAQGLGGIQASRASIIGGADATSNVFAGYAYNIPISGTQAHSWILSFENELVAFRKFAEYYPNNTVLLVDTYDTLKSGVPNAIIVAKEMESRGEKMLAVRLDSGDLAYLSKEARKMLDANNLQYVKIAATNSLDEYIIKSLDEQGARIDIFGVGTKLVTADPTPALDGVYKLANINGLPRVKISENVAKMTLPDVKNVLRVYNADNQFYADAIALQNETSVDMIYHPHFQYKNLSIKNLKTESLLNLVMEKGKIIGNLPSISESAIYARQRLSLLPQESKRFENPHIYKISISEKLMQLRDNMVAEKRKISTQ